MEKKKFYIGIDISNETFYSKILNKPGKDTPSKECNNSIDGFKDFFSWLTKNKVSAANSLICMEATGVYCDRLCYYLASKGFNLVVEAPHKVKRAFTKLAKSDSVDSGQIAEYAYRFHDQLKLWQPKAEIVEQIQALLTTREQLVIHKSANQHALVALKKKHISTPFAMDALKNIIKIHDKQINSIEDEMKKLVKNDKDLFQMMSLITGIPSVKHLMFYNLLVHTEGFVKEVKPRNLASFCGIAPLEHTSGSSVYKRPKSKRRGPPRFRKILFLAAISLRAHNENFKKYFFRKLAEGKSKRLILNNIENKLLKIICAVINKKQPYIKTYVSVNPNLLN